MLEHADLQLRSKPRTEALSAEQEERRLLLFDLLIALFERAYLLVYEDDMSRKQARLWQSWEDYMHFWCQREDFRALLPEMLDGEDRTSPGTCCALPPPRPAPASELAGLVRDVADVVAAIGLGFIQLQVGALDGLVEGFTRLQDRQAASRVTGTSPGWMRVRCASWRMRSATVMASSACSSSISMTNSSPPQRQIKSAARRAL